MRSDHHAGRTWARKARRRLSSDGARHGMSLISAITSRGHMRFMLVEKGGVNADVFIEFLKRLTAGAKRASFSSSIADQLISPRNQGVCRQFEWCATAVLFAALLARSQSRRTRVEASESRHGRAHDGDEQGRLQKQVRSSMRQLQNNPAKSAPSIKNHLSDMPRERRDTYELIKSARFEGGKRTAVLTPFLQVRCQRFIKPIFSTPLSSMAMVRRQRRRKAATTSVSAATRRSKATKSSPSAIAIVNVIAPFVSAPGNRNESPLLREALPLVTHIAYAVGIDLQGTIVSLDGV